MKLPGPIYTRGQSSFGRDQTDPTQVSRALFSAAQTEAGVGTALAGAAAETARAGATMASLGDATASIGKSYLATGNAQANIGSEMVRTGNLMFAQTTAKGLISKALTQTADVFDTWDKASDAARMHEGMARYVTSMTELMDNFKTKLTVKAADLPEGVLNPNDPREIVPTWEVMPKVYDMAERAAARDAVAGITRTEHRQEMALQLANKRASNGSTVRNQYIVEMKKDLVGRDEETIRKFVNAGKPQDAVNVVENGFKNGTYDFVDRVKKIEKIWHDDEDLKTAREIGELNSVFMLHEVAARVLGKKESRLTPDERRAYANQAMTKADSIAKADEVRRLREERDASKRVLGTLGERVRLHGYIPTHQDLMEAQKVLSPTDYLALLALVDRKDGNGQVKPDPATVNDLSQKIIALGKPDSAGTPNHLRADMVMDQINLAFAGNRLDMPMHEKLVAMLERYRDRAIKKNPEHALADDLIDSNILPPKGFLEQLTAGELTRYGSLAQDMKIELNEATRKDPKLDPVAWVRQNLPRYKALIGSQVHTALFKMGLGQYVVQGATALDPVATQVNLKKAFDAQQISGAMYKQAIDQLSIIGAPAPQTQRRGEKK